MNRISLLSLVACLLFLGTSCSAPQKTVTDTQMEEKEPEVSKYPSWYGEQSMVSSDSVLFGYASSLRADSSNAAAKAREVAKNKLEAGISDKLEDVRSEAIKEYDKDYGLNRARFLVALREADNGLSEIAEISNVEARSVDGYNSYRGFAEASISKAQMIAELDEQLADFERSWQAMKDSKAFQSF